MYCIQESEGCACFCKCKSREHLAWVYNRNVDIETFGAAEACSHRSVHHVPSKQHKQHCLSSPEGDGGSLKWLGHPWNKDGAGHKSRLACHSHIPAKQELPSNFCHVGEARPVQFRHGPGTAEGPGDHSIDYRSKPANLYFIPAQDCNCHN